MPCGTGNFAYQHTLTSEFLRKIWVIATFDTCVEGVRVTILVDRHRKTTLLLALGVVLSRLPFLGYGYGTDPDAWRVIVSVQRFLNTGVYVPSRPPGYPLSEYVVAAMLSIGLGSSFWIGLLSTILSGFAVALLFWILLPLGYARALAGSLAFALTPAVYVAALGAMDYLWGVSLFLAASVFASKQHTWPACIFLGFATASRPTYVVAVVPIVLLLYVSWKKLIAPLICAALIVILFYVPELIVLGRGAFWAAEGHDNLQHAIFYASVGLFGVFGFLGVAYTIVSGILNRCNGIECDPGERMNLWAFSSLVLFGLLFLAVPQEPAYLIPTLPGLYWLLCRYAQQVVLWVMVGLLLVSCFVLKVGGKPIRVDLNGPVLWEVQEQNQRRCVANWLKGWLTSHEGYVVVGYYRPQLAVEIGKPYSDRIMYIVRPEDGSLRDTEFRYTAFPDLPSSPSSLPSNAKLWVLDRRTDQQDSTWPGNDLPVLSSDGRCRQEPRLSLTKIR